MTWRPRLRTILLIVNLTILCLPLAGIAVLRIYESALIRQTESELIAQGAFIAAAYRAAFARIAADSGLGAEALARYGIPVARQWLPEQGSTGRWRPRPPILDLATDTIRPPQEAALMPARIPEPLALAVGRELAPMLRDAQVVTLAGIRVVDYQGIIVASTGEASGMSLAYSEEVVRALQGESVSLLRTRLLDDAPPPLVSISRGTRLRVFTATPITRDRRVLGAVVLSRTPSNIAHALYGKRYLLLQLTLTLLVAIALLSVFTSLTISRPVHAVIAQARRAVRGEKGAVTPLANPATQEIAQLSDAVAAMAQTLERRADYIRTFATHVSHEFKTPLSAIKGAVELLRDHGHTMPAEERDRFLNNLDQDSQRLEGLVRRLLELARADMMTVGTEATDAAAVIEAVVARYRRQGVRVVMEKEPNMPLLAMSGETLDSIVSSLIDNARQHGGANVTIRLGVGRAKPRRKPSPAFITVADDGPGISPANAKRIFEPFFTTSRKRGGTGLGLAVVRSLLAAHQGTITLVPTDLGATFQVRVATAE